MPSAVICKLLLSSLDARPRCFKYHSAELNSTAVASTMISRCRIETARSGRPGAPPIVEQAKNGRTSKRFASQRAKELDTVEFRATGVLADALSFVELHGGASGSERTSKAKLTASNISALPVVELLG